MYAFGIVLMEILTGQQQMLIAEKVRKLLPFAKFNFLCQPKSISTLSWNAMPHREPNTNDNIDSVAPGI